MTDRSSLPTVLAALCLSLLLGPLLGCKRGEEHTSQGTSGPASASAAPGAVPSSASTLQRVSFVRGVPKKDQVIVYQYERGITMSLSVKQGGKVIKEGNVRDGDTLKKKITVLSSDEWSVNRVRCEYLDKSSTSSQDGGELKKRISVVSGKTYIVKAKNGEIEVTDADGEPVTKQELTEVKNDHDDLGKPNKLNNLLPDRPIALGEKLSPPPSVILAMLDLLMPSSGQEPLAVKDAGLTFKSVEGTGANRVAVFDMSLTVIASAQDGKPPAEMALNGTLKLLVDSLLPIEIALKGPITIAASENGMAIRGKGQVKISASATY